MYSIHSAKEALLPRERLMTYGPESLSKIIGYIIANWY